MKKVHIYSLLVLNLIAVFTLVGCGNSSDKNLSNKNTKNIEVIETVLEKTLNAPDKALLSKLYDPTNATVIDQGSEETTVTPVDENNDLDQYLEDNYGEYFTDYGYEKFFVTSGEGFNYSIAADQANYTLTTGKINVIKDEKNSQRYQFEGTVNYTDASNENRTNIISGRVEMEDEKINSLNINDDEGLLQEMMDKQ